MSKMYIQESRLPEMKDMKLSNGDRCKMLRFLVSEMAERIFNGIAPWCVNGEIKVKIYITTEEDEK